MSAQKKKAGSRKGKEGSPSRGRQDTGGPGLRETIGALWWCITSGCLTFLAFPLRPVPESSIWILAWVCLAPLIYVTRGSTPKRAFLFGLVMGTVTNFGGFWWISIVVHDFGHLPAPLAWGLTCLNATYQGLQFGIFASLLAVLGKRAGGVGIWTTAALFTAIEFCFPLIFPWYMGNSQYRFLAAVQVADILGVAGVTFTLVLANALVVELFTTRKLTRAGASGLGWVILVLAYGGVRLWMIDSAIEEAPRLRVGMVEANVCILEKEAKGLNPEERRRTLHGNLLKHQRMSRALEEEDVDLIVWPESSYIPDGLVHTKRLDSFAMGVGPGSHLRVWRDQADGGRSWSMGAELHGGLNLRSIDACREDAAVIGGDAGALLFWDGYGAKPVPVGSLAPGADAPDLLGVSIAGRGRPHLNADGAPIRIYAVGEDGLVLTGDDKGVRRVASGSDKTLRAVAATNRQQAIAVGDNGTLLLLDEDGGRPMNSETDLDLHGIWPDRVSGRAWAVGASGVILRGNGRRWVAERPPDDGGALRAIAGTGPLDLWAVGDGGRIFARQRDGSWKVEAIPTRVDLLSVAVTPDQEVFVGAEDGGLWRRTQGRKGRWVAAEAPGIGPLRDLHGLPWVRSRPIPRDARYIQPSEVALPDAESYDQDPNPEFAQDTTDRAAVQRGYDTPVLFGALTWRDTSGPGGRTLRYNTAVMLDDKGRVVGMYDKVYLLVFGEYIPLGEIFPIVYDWIPAAGRFTPGTDVQVFDWNGHRIGVLICYEDILPAFAADVVARGPDILINITNDAWFGRTGEPYLHMALSVMRSVESRKTLIRSTNTGVSVIVDPAGRILRRTDLDTAESVVASVPILKKETIYGHVGDLFAHLVLLWSTIAIVMALRGRS